MQSNNSEKQMSLRELNVAFRSVWVYDHASKGLRKSSEVLKYGRLEDATHTATNPEGEIFDIIASEKKPFA